MTKFFILDPYNNEVSRFETEAAAIKHLEQESLDSCSTVASWMEQHDIVVVEGAEMLYKPPRDSASLVPKGK